MAESTIPNGPESPETPLTLSVDGDLGAVEFVRRLHRGGLQLRNADDGSYAVIVRAEREPQPERGIRVELFQASGIIHAVRSALECSEHVDVDEVQLASALEAAQQLVDNAAGQLEGAQ